VLAYAKRTLNLPSLFFRFDKPSSLNTSITVSDSTTRGARQSFLESYAAAPPRRSSRSGTPEIATLRPTSTATRAFKRPLLHDRPRAAAKARKYYDEIVRRKVQSHRSLNHRPRFDSHTKAILVTTIAFDEARHQILSR
jgi:hypothetical protein